ncbi:hypothetical protein [Idiomarina abyssalis]|uniref:Uncharacterized protein n=1 Tax=Idiomarina abyssalis TaxID=86102 RepID=A0A8I1KFE6_9GAMM|nr:hypothetical protein [Idiomarina abyssalis]MBJ7265435.1 hypothetical protein [Idiomarina abyssalis]MBJ7316891.1 hypothetical protein [Idiomarina abyssalis]
MKSVSTSGVLSLALSAGLLSVIPLSLTLFNGSFMYSVTYSGVLIVFICALFKQSNLERLAEELKHYSSLPAFCSRQELDQYVTQKTTFHERGLKFLASLEFLFALNVSVAAGVQFHSIMFSNLALLNILLSGIFGLVTLVISLALLIKSFSKLVVAKLYPCEQHPISGAIYLDKPDEQAYYIGHIGSSKDKKRLSRVVRKRYPQLHTKTGLPWGVFHINHPN